MYRSVAEWLKRIAQNGRVQSPDPRGPSVVKNMFKKMMIPKGEPRKLLSNYLV